MAAYFDAGSLAARSVAVESLALGSPAALALLPGFKLLLDAVLLRLFVAVGQQQPLLLLVLHHQKMRSLALMQHKCCHAVETFHPEAFQLTGGFVLLPPPCCCCWPSLKLA